MAYSELIKSFDKIRDYIREFYVYGFKSRMEYTQKSSRSYDDERRRIESWLSEDTRSAMTPEGKHVYLSIDSRAYRHNPLYKAWKAKSFTDGDITLHFILFEILFRNDIALSLNQLTDAIDSTLAQAGSQLSFDESTLRKKLKEYSELGIITAKKEGKKLLYSRAPDTDIRTLADLLDYFSEAAPLGVIGSFLLDKLPSHPEIFSFKHHYITETVDSEVLALLFDAMGDHCFVTGLNQPLRRKQNEAFRVLPLKIYISVQSGRQNLVGYDPEKKHFITFRLDRLSGIRKEEPCEDFDRLRTLLTENEQYMWGVNTKLCIRDLEHIEFDVKVEEGEGHIINRLYREKRCGRVQQRSPKLYCFSADVFEATEMVPWIRSFLCRITRLECSNKRVEETFREDLTAMYRLYGLEGGTANDIQ